MTSNNHRQGKKFGGTHTSVIEAALPVVDFLATCPEVANISPGFIKSGLGSAGGQYRLKISKFQGGVLLSVRGNISQQEIRVYSRDVEATKNALLEVSHDLKYNIVTTV